MIKSNIPSPGLLHRVIDATQWLDAPVRNYILDRIDREHGIINDDFRTEIVRAFRSRVAQEGGVAALQAQLRGENIVLRDLAQEVGRLGAVAEGETSPAQEEFEADVREQQGRVLTQFTQEMDGIARRVDTRVEGSARTTDAQAMARLYQTLNAPQTSSPPKEAHDGLPEFSAN